MGMAQTNARKVGKESAADIVIRKILSPVSSSISGGKNALFSVGQSIFTSFALQRENRVLKEKLNGLALYEETTTRLTKEIDSLRGLSGLAATYDRPKLYADVEGYFPQENRITLGVGSKKGVKPGQPVVSSEGLVGIVQTVSDFDCQARLLNSVGPSLGALAISHSPPIAGVLRGDTPFPSVIFSDPSAPIQMNDLITTSGFSSKIPRGITIGRVIQIVDSPETGSRKAMINLQVKVSTLREVIILL